MELTTGSDFRNLILMGDGGEQGGDAELISDEGEDEDGGLWDKKRLVKPVYVLILVRYARRTYEIVFGIMLTISLPALSVWKLTWCLFRAECFWFVAESTNIVQLWQSIVKNTCIIEY